VKIYASLQMKDESKVWNQFTTEEFDIQPDEYHIYPFELKIPVDEEYRIRAAVWAENATTIEWTSTWGES